MTVVAGAPVPVEAEMAATKPKADVMTRIGATSKMQAAVEVDNEGAAKTSGITGMRGTAGAMTAMPPMIGRAAEMSETIGTGL